MRRYIRLRIEVFHSSRLLITRKQAKKNFVQIRRKTFPEGRIREFWSVSLERKSLGVEPKNIQLYKVFKPINQHYHKGKIKRTSNKKYHIITHTCTNSVVYGKI